MFAGADEEVTGRTYRTGESRLRSEHWCRGIAGPVVPERLIAVNISSV